MALFPLPVKAEMSDRFRMPVRSLQFGDGYEQVARLGLNRPIDIWSIQVIISNSTDNDAFELFLDIHGQHRIFFWQSPRDTSPSPYRIVGEVSGTTRNGGGVLPIYFTRSMTFKQVYPTTIAETLNSPNITTFITT